MTMRKKIANIAALVTLLAVPTVVEAQQVPKAAPEVVERYVKTMWKSPPPGWQARIDQDETQKVCSEARNAPAAAVAQQITEREKATIVFPADGNVMGDWKAGEKVAQTGTGGQFTDPPDAVKGGNCYACHQMAAKEASYGTLGPSLLEYGKNRKFKPEEAKQAYAKIFNAQAVQACSNMPRFGVHKYLTEQQMKDVTAYLFDPESPVNKP